MRKPACLVLYACMYAMFFFIQVQLSVILTYLRHIGFFISAMILLMYMLNIAAAIYSNVWLSEWSDDMNEVNTTLDTNQRDLRLGVYGALGLAQGEKPILVNFQWKKSGNHLMKKEFKEQPFVA